MALTGPHPIGGLAIRQLAAWQALAARWPLELDSDGYPWIWRCPDCGIGVMLDTDTRGVPYRWTEADRLSAVVLHLRTRHATLDPAEHVR